MGVGAVLELSSRGSNYERQIGHGKGVIRVGLG